MTLPNATDEDTPGRTAYEAYGTYVDWRSVTGTPIPPWEENHNSAVKDGWEQAAQAVLNRWRD